jgi:hypothetical protein
VDYFADSTEHLLAELERIDLLVRSGVVKAREQYAEDEQFRGLYVSEQELDSLLERPIGRPGWMRDDSPATRVQDALGEIGASIERRARESRQRGVELRLDRLRELFELDGFELDILLICLAVEIDLRYERIYAYLQDDVTRKRPSVDLVLSLLLPEAGVRFGTRQYFDGGAPLFAHRLLHFIEDPSQPSPPLLARLVKVDERIVRYLFESDKIDHRIAGFAALLHPDRRLESLVLDDSLRHSLGGLQLASQAATQPLMYLEGPYGSGRQSLAEAVCCEKGVSLLVVDLNRLRDSGDETFREDMVLVSREARLQQAVLLWKGLEYLLQDEHRRLLKAFERTLEDRGTVTFVAGDGHWTPTAGLGNVMRIELGRPTAQARSDLWVEALDGSAVAEAALEIHQLAGKFRFTGGQIRDAARTARDLARWRDPGDPTITVEVLYEACRQHSSKGLAKLARKITPKYRWEDIVLPADRLEQLREICNQVKYRERVYDEWGFDRKLSLGKGLSILFAGPSGTGKTMAADIIAHELGLDLYKIDLSTVVSKYIGETEKNLSRIFTEAETSNAILFFDEADALFGKRSEVKDSHDRYANIETGYLLQRMEEYDGVVILATNLRKNLDEAFVRRLHVTLDFPFPDQVDRRRIWEGIWPQATPRDPGMDLEFMARRFEITGGNIRNIALATAFLAADSGGRVEMAHLVRATQREYQKMGKVFTENEFAGLGEAVPQRLGRERRANSPSMSPLRATANDEVLHE